MEAAPEAAIAHVAAIAPDLVVIARTPIEGELLDVVGGALPVVVVGSEDTDTVGRFGVVAQWSDALDADVMAMRVQTLLAHLDHSETILVCDDVEARESWLARLTARGKTGFVVHADGAIAMLRRGRITPSGIAEADLSSAVRFVEVPAHRVRFAHDPAQSSSLAGARVLLVDVAQRSSTCQALRSAGALVQTLDSRDAPIDPAIALVPSVVVISTDAMRAGLPSDIWSSERFSGASFVVVEEWDDDRLASAVAEACLPERAARETIERQGILVDRIQPFGPARWLKVLAGLDRELKLQITCPSGDIDVELAGAKLRSAKWTCADGSVVPGKEALVALLSTRRGRITATNAQLVDAPREGSSADASKAASAPVPSSAVMAPKQPSPRSTATERSRSSLSAAAPANGVARVSSQTARALDILSAKVAKKPHAGTARSSATHGNAGRMNGGAARASMARRPALELPAKPASVPRPPRMPEHGSNGEAAPIVSKLRPIQAVPRASDPPPPRRSAPPPPPRRSSAPSAPPPPSAAGNRPSSPPRRSLPLPEGADLRPPLHARETKTLPARRENSAERSGIPASGASVDLWGLGDRKSGAPPPIERADDEGAARCAVAHVTTPTLVTVDRDGRRVAVPKRLARILELLDRLDGWTIDARTLRNIAAAMIGAAAAGIVMIAIAWLRTSHSSASVEVVDLPPRQTPVIAASQAAPRMTFEITREEIDVDQIARDAQQAFAAGGYVQAEELAREALRYAPYRADIHYQLARALARQGRDDEALEAVERAIERAPRAGAYYLLAADLHSRNGRSAHAARVWRECAAEQPDYQPCQERLTARASAMVRVRRPTWLR